MKLSRIWLVVIDFAITACTMYGRAHAIMYMLLPIMLIYGTQFIYSYYSVMADGILAEYLMVVAREVLVYYDILLSSVKGFY